MVEQGGHLSEKARHDYELVRAALDGDENAFARLLGRYKDAIFFMLLKMVNNKSDAEDLTLEAFGKAFKNLHQYSPNYAFSTWLFKIASNNCIDFLRKRKGSTVTLETTIENNDTELPSKLRSKDPNPEEKLIRKQKAILMRRVVRKLKPRYQTLVEYRYFRELSYEEIARELKLPLGTVKAQLFRAREMLFKLIETTEMGERE
ncbi:MAG: sigma-70 family RNA polymerase sigma factor [Prolixibacteraceae bacterium]|jgi:RNA polymerase sigma-70 factor (ECF subfamily)|nr:sigma-70 family RNA polymerase sigma factor [Prolixibacteraceae bacterium]MDI9563301.1 sigma-70 family RNA polymerase sigma factor [Bacteroidota bacterium]NLS98635.1 sigma-70 family RNA polymerase sigma factor [Bacteroidales bacterium]OQB80362.1 MAG: ECF RNA polymerase sigma factor SigW [Bacteroidetes bacterium ADurb.Bin123]HNU77561.1 sigma-70 family RNA polymerase sigma factor [Prolixibacteraceae bacterium]